jgi:hypothetical protein
MITKLDMRQSETVAEREEKVVEKDKSANT